jgi:hypothetical protein
MSGFDRVLRGVAATCAVAVVVLAAVNSQLPLASSSDVRATPPAEQAGAAGRRARDGRTEGYSFLLSSPDHRYPGRWCPGTIGYYVDTALLAEGGMTASEELLRWEDTFQAWAQASQGRYTFAYLGERTLAMDASGEPAVASVEPGTIGITYVHDAAEGGQPDYRSAAVAGRTAGNGGLQVISGDSEASALVGDRGFVLIDVNDAAELPADGLRRSLYQHESGHALGLGHVADEGALMNGTLSTSRPRISTVDARGLVELSRMPCTG